MGNETSGTVSFEIDQRARLFAFDLARDENVGLIPLFRDIATVLEVVEKRGGENGIDSHEVHREIAEDLHTDMGPELEPVLDFLKEMGLVEKNTLGNWKCRSSSRDSDGTGVSYL